jgi:hypothetical protein
MVPFPGMEGNEIEHMIFVEDRIRQQEGERIPR